MAIRTTVAANFGTKRNPAVKNIRFVATAKKVTVSAKDLPKIVIRQDEQGGFVALVNNGKRKTPTFFAKNPEVAYKRAVRASW